MMARIIFSVKVARHRRRCGKELALGGFACGEAFSALEFHSGRTPRTRGSAIESFLDVAAVAHGIQKLPLQASTIPTLAKNARMGHPLCLCCQKIKSPGPKAKTLARVQVSGCRPRIC